MTSDTSPHAATFASALSTRPQLSDAVEELCEQIEAQLPTSPTLIVFFVSHAYADQWQAITGYFRNRWANVHLMGCSAEGVVGRREEIEEGPAISAWCTALPKGIGVAPFRLDFERTADGGVILGWPDAWIDNWPADQTLLIMAEPFSFPADFLMETLKQQGKPLQLIGGMASGAQTPGHNRLFLNDEVLESGAVVWLVSDELSVTSVVSQGCRPVGEKFIVTASDRNLVLQLGGKPALQQLQEVFDNLPNHEKQLVQHGLHIGRVVNEYQDDFEMGDFLIRNVLGIDRESNAIGVGDYLRVGQTVQFHLRDEPIASAELQQRLRDFHSNHTAESALLFTCNGRGSRLFQTPHHDAETLAQIVGDIPLAGFFAQGEIGPVSGENFLHGFTASIAFFARAEPAGD